jgi:hypothetical protein
MISPAGYPWENRLVMNQYFPIANFAVGVITLGVLFWYAWETMRLRKAATDQVEAMSKPCLTLWAKLRNQDDAILEMDGAVGALVARGDGANFVVQNIGTGVALNVTYRFNNLDSPERIRLKDKSYLVNVLPGQKISMPEPMNASNYSGNCELLFCFESIGGKHYQSIVTMNGHVLTSFQLKAI